MVCYVWDDDVLFFFFQAEDGIRDVAVTGVQTCALPIFGASGCGKSTLMRMLTGLSPATGGAVYWHGQPVDGRFRNVSIVFQSFALFPWLTVIENVEIGRAHV